MTSSPRSLGRLPEFTLWAGAAVVVFAAEGYRSGDAARYDTILALGVISAAFGVRVFYGHGGGRITTLGLFNFAAVLFVGYAAIAEALDPQRRTDASYVTAAVTLALSVQVVITLLAWSRAAPGADEPLGYLGDERGRRLTLIGISALSGLFVAQRAGLPLATTGLADGAASCAVLLVAVGLLLRENTRLVSGRLVLVAGTFAAYALLFHQGTGRLRLVALACGIAILTTARFPSRILKLVTVAVTPPAIWWLAQDRLALQESLAAGSSQGRSGLESMISPILVLGQLLEAQAHGFGLAWGSNFLSLPVSLAPDWLTGGAGPGALGYELVRVTAPGRYRSGYSVAGTAPAEWVYNFGLFGIVLMVPVMVWLLQTLDRGLRVALTDPDRLIRLVVLVMLAGGIADLVWSGFHTWGARTIARLPLLLIAAVLLDRHRSMLAPLSHASRQKPERPASEPNTTPTVHPELRSKPGKNTILE